MRKSVVLEKGSSWRDEPQKNLKLAKTPVDAAVLDAINLWADDTAEMVA